MRNLICMAGLCLLSICQLNAQDQTTYSGSYKFSTGLVSDFSSLIIKGKNNNLPFNKGNKITVVSTEGDNVYFKFWDFPEKNPKSATYNNQVFTLSKKDFDDLTEPIYPEFKGVSVGAYTVPFRLRGIGNDFDFESSLSLQANIVFGLGPESSPRSKYDLSAGIGLTSINLTPDNTDNGVTDIRTASAFTLSGGFLWKPDEVVNIGAFVGWDMLGANDSEVNWQYNGGTWVGIGINISFNAIRADNTPIIGVNP